jgi:hypothetical protein
MQEMTVGEIEDVSGGGDAQMKILHAQEILSFISNMLKKKSEMAMSVIANLK